MEVTALDEAGQKVDWFFIYKVPQLSEGATTAKTTGYEYVYYDSSIDQQMPVSKRNIVKSPYVLNSDQGALNRTLDSAFNKPDSTTGWILYNDERPGDVPGNDNGALGHTKGVLAFDTATKTGYWLLHSWPKFAEPKAKTDPTPKYGQTYLCLSLTLDTLQTIASLMIDYQQPQTYLNEVDCLKENTTDPLYKLAQGVNPNASGDSKVLDLKTVGGMAFKVIAKNRLWNQDFWNGLVGPTLHDDLDVDTWIRGPIPPVADTDGIHKTFDIKYINLGPLGILYGGEARNSRSREVGHHDACELGVCRRHKSHDLAAQTGWRNDRIPKSNTVAGAVKDRSSVGTTRHDSRPGSRDHPRDPL